MAQTGSPPPNLRPWSAPDSLGYSVWNRLTRFGTSTSGAGLAISGNTSAIYDRHISFLGILTVQPPGLASTPPRRRVDDLRVFRRATAPAAALFRQRWPFAISELPTTASRGSAFELWPLPGRGRELPALTRTAVALSAIPAGRAELPVSTARERRGIRQPISPMPSVTATNVAVEFTPRAMAYRSLSPVSQPISPAGALRTPSDQIAASTRSSIVFHDRDRPTSKPASRLVAVDRRRASATLLGAAHAGAA